MVSASEGKLPLSPPPPPTHSLTLSLSAHVCIPLFALSHSLFYGFFSLSLFTCLFIFLFPTPVYIPPVFTHVHFPHVLTFSHFPPCVSENLSSHAPSHILPLPPTGFSFHPCIYPSRFPLSLSRPHPSVSRLPTPTIPLCLSLKPRLSLKQKRPP